MPIILTFPDNYNNSPKSLMVLDFYKYLLEFDVERVESLVADDFICAIYGHGEYLGKKGLRQMINDTKASGMKSLKVINVVSHGDNVALNGEVIMQDGTKMAFAEFFTFESHSKNAKIMREDSYTVAVGSDQ